MYCLSDLCFLCLVRTESIKSVLSQGDDNVVIEEKLECVLSELINFRPEIPKNICSDCLKGLNYVYKFKQKCLENLVTLNEYIDKLDIKSTHFLSPDTENTTLDKTNTDESTIEVPTKPKKFICDICHKGFVQISHLKDHLLSHSGDKSFKCQTCDFKCTRSASLKRHMQIHLRDKHTCNYCQQSFSTASYLKKHVNIRHNDNEKPVEVNSNDDCQVSVVIKVEPNDLAVDDALQDMQQSISEVCQPKEGIEDGCVDISAEPPVQPFKKPYTCPQCNKTFRDRYNLESHHRTHTGARPFQCSTCQKSFRQSSVLRAHERIHTGDRPYGCEVCGKSFNDVSTLIKHKRVHNNLRPYKCTLCEKRFKLSGHRTKHMVNVHGCVREPYEIVY